jgi:hypothetical protein
MQVISTSLLSMQESYADTKAYEVKILNKKCTQNNDKTQNTQTMKDEITQQSLKMSNKKKTFKLGCGKQKDLNHSKKRDALKEIEHKLKTNQTFADSFNQLDN